MKATDIALLTELIGLNKHLVFYKHHAPNGAVNRAARRII